MSSDDYNGGVDNKSPYKQRGWRELIENLIPIAGGVGAGGTAAHFTGDPQLFWVFAIPFIIKECLTWIQKYLKQNEDRKFDKYINRKIMELIEKLDKHIIALEKDGNDKKSIQIIKVTKEFIEDINGFRKK